MGDLFGNMTSSPGKRRAGLGTLEEAVLPSDKWVFCNRPHKLFLIPLHFVSAPTMCCQCPNHVPQLQKLLFFCFNSVSEEGFSPSFHWKEGQGSYSTMKDVRKTSNNNYMFQNPSWCCVFSKSIFSQRVW